MELLRIRMKLMSEFYDIHPNHLVSTAAREVTIGTYFLFGFLLTSPKQYE